MVKGNKGGRPTKYKKEYCRDVVEWLSEGKLMYEFAQHINVHICSIYEWQEKHDEFSEACKKGERYKTYIAEKFVKDAIHDKDINNVPFIVYCRNFLKLKTKDHEPKDDGDNKQDNFADAIKD